MALSLDAFRSPADSKHYRVFTLANGLEVMLVQNEISATNSSSSCGADTGTEPDPEPAGTPVSSSSRTRRLSFFSTASDDEGETDDDDSADSPPASTCAAACLTVSVGSMMDPPDIRGLAHYLEHMLFMGNAAFPDENDFEAFLSTHGGYSNGATESESTRFVFEVGAFHLEPALERFAQCFVSPLLTHDALARELLAVESEFQRAMANDYVRLQQIQCATCKPGHLYDSFSWGNRESLESIPAAKGIDVRAAMRAFFERYYRPSAMKLCVYGHDTLDTMEQWVTASFGAIAAPKSIDSVCYDPVVQDLATPPPFGAAAGQDPVVIKIKPVSTMHAMHLYWPLPPLFRDYRQKPSEFLAHVLGHEGAGSLTAVLKHHGWGTYVTAGVTETDSYESGSFGCLFEVGVTLTRNGVAHWRDVVHVIFDVVHYTRLQAVSDGHFPAYIYDELKASTEIAHMYQEEPEPLTLCKRLSHLMQTRYTVDRTDLLRYDLIQGAFDEKYVRAVLDRMTPANTRVVLFSHAFDESSETLPVPSELVVAPADWQTERWIGTKYAVAPIASDVLAQWRVPTARQAELRHPSRNPFMPKSFHVLASRASTSSASTAMSSDDDCCDDKDDVDALVSTATAPALVCTTAMSKLWFKQDDTFFVPKTNAHFLLCLPALTQSVSHYVCAVIYTKLVTDALQQASYQASNANLRFDVDIRDLDVEVTVGGFSDSVDAVVRVVFDALVATRIAPATFALARDALLREYQNVHLKPAAKARYLRLQLLERSAFAIEDKVDALAAVTLADVEHFRDVGMWQSGIGTSGTKSSTSGVTLRSLVHGNCTEADAVALQRYVEELLLTHMHRAAADTDVDTKVPAPLVPRTPTRPHTTELPLTANGILLRAMSEHDAETNSAVEVYYQLGKCSYVEHAYASLLHQIMQEPLFHALRTQQQLGYDVACCVRDTHGVLGFSIAVQSASHAASDIAMRIDAFVHDTFLTLLEGLAVDAFDRHVETLTRLHARAPANLTDETYRYWDEIQSRRLDFAATREVGAALGECTLDGLLAYYRLWLLTAPSDSTDTNDNGARKLRVHVVGKCSHFVPLEDVVSRDAAPQVVKNLREYKNALRCHC